MGNHFRKSSSAGAVSRNPVLFLILLFTLGLHAICPTTLALAKSSVPQVGDPVAWGDNGYCQGALPPDLSGTINVAAGLGHSLALKGDGTVVAWGYNWAGQCSVPGGLSGVVAVAAGEGHSLALKSDGTVVAWGWNWYGQCNVPTGLSGVTAVAAGGAHNLALKADGTVVAWGNNQYGQCNVPAGLSGVVAVAAGGWHNLALKSDGTVVAWGYNYYGQSTVPEAAQSGVIAIAAGNMHNLALKSDGTVVAWGYNQAGQCNVPTGLSGVVAIAAGWGHNLAIKGDGTVVAWGDNQGGQCNVPTGLSGVVAVDVGGAHSLALKGDGTVVAWGANYSGQSTVPDGLNGVVAFAAGELHSLALKADGTVVAWGDNQGGQCNVPAGLTGAVAVAAGELHSLALKSDGTVVAWGCIWDGNGYIQCTVPEGLSNAIAIASGYSHNLALKSDGTVVAWGDNECGQCNVPEGLGGIITIAAGDWHNLVLKARPVNHPPVAADYALATHTDTAVVINVLANASDPDGDRLTVTNVTPGTHGTVAIATDGKTVTYTPAPDSPGPDSFAYGISDGWGGTAVGGVTITIDPINVPTPPGAITAPTEPVNIACVVLASATFTAPVQAAVHTALWDWGDGVKSRGLIEASGKVTGSHAYAQVGVYTVKLTVTAATQAERTLEFSPIVIYAPEAGYITGRGTIISPPGAYAAAANPAVTGKATFGFVSRYQKGATLPTGKTDFQFKAGGLDFSSDAYEWMLVAGAKAIYKGEGTINGAGSYGFMLSAIDGDLLGGGGVDKFRIKIWDKATGTTVYDNQVGTADSADPATAIESGKITIHK